MSAESVPVKASSTNPPVAARPEASVRRETLRRRLLRANWLVVVALGLVLLLAGGVLWQSSRAGRLQSQAYREQVRAEQAESGARGELWKSLLAESRTTRLGQRLDRRGLSLSSIERAAGIATTPELRREAAATLALPELRLDSTVELNPESTANEMDRELQFFADGLANGDVLIRRLSDGSQVRRLRMADGPVPVEQGRVVTMNFSPGARLLSVRHAFGALAVWDLEDGRLLYVRDADQLRHPASRGEFNADGEFLVAAMFNPEGFGVLEARTGKLIDHYPELGSQHHASIRPGTHQFAAYSDGQVRLLDWDRRIEVRRFPFPSGSRALAWSLDGRQLAIAGNSPDVEVWEVESGQRKVFPGHQDDVYAVAFDPSGTLLTTYTLDKFSRIWNLRSSRLLVTTEDGWLRSWSPDLRTGWWAKKTQLEVRHMAVSPVYDTGAEDLGPLDGSTLDTSADGRWGLVRTDRGEVWIYNLERPQTAQHLELKPVDSVMFHPREPRLVLARGNGMEEVGYRPATNQAGIWLQLDPPRQQELFRPARAVIPSTDGRRMVGRNEHEGIVWIEDRESGENARIFRDLLHSSVDSRLCGVRGASSVSLSPDGRWLACGADRTKVFDAATGRLVRELDPVLGGVQFSPDGRWLVLAAPGTCHVYRTADWGLEWSLPLSARRPSRSGAAAFSPDGSQLAVAWSTRSVMLLDTASGRSLVELESPHSSPVRQLSWTADGERIVGLNRAEALDIWRPRALRAELSKLGLSWDQPEKSLPTFAAGAGVVQAALPGWVLFLVLATVGIVSLVALGSLQRHRTLVEEFARSEERASRREHELAVEREVNELKSRFVSMVSHEFRTPLGITMSAVELLRNYLNRLPPAKLKELLEDIYQSTLRMSGLMEQVLLLGRVESGRLGCQIAPVDLPALLARALDETQSATHRRCELMLHAEAAELSGAQGDEALMRHILNNLVSNAIKYSPAGSTVEVAAHRDDSMAVLTVKDTGIGIPAADQAQLFEAFHRGTNVGEIAGTGLGLLIVKRCVDLHQGRIEWVSAEGRGTTFTVSLPLFAKPGDDRG